MKKTKTILLLLIMSFLLMNFSCTTSSNEDVKIEDLSDIDKNLRQEIFQVLF